MWYFRDDERLEFIYVGSGPRQPRRESWHWPYRPCHAKAGSKRQRRPEQKLRPARGSEPVAIRRAGFGKPACVSRKYDYGWKLECGDVDDVISRFGRLLQEIHFARPLRGHDTRSDLNMYKIGVQCVVDVVLQDRP
jgi:hypothetical protein